MLNLIYVRRKSNAEPARADDVEKAKKAELEALQKSLFAQSARANGQRAGKGGNHEIIDLTSDKEVDEHDGALEGTEDDDWLN